MRRYKKQKKLQMLHLSSWYFHFQEIRYSGFLEFYINFLRISFLEKIFFFKEYLDVAVFNEGFIMLTG